MRAIPQDFDAATVAAIDARLDTVVHNERVAMPLAIESGSRAWGFPSPDSDYDCRFLFVRRRRDYLSLWPCRDVIETPLDGLLDVNGWDLAKALRLIVRGNAVAIEWLRSPIVYRGDPAFRDALLNFADQHAPLPLIGRHYLHLGRREWRRAEGVEAVAIKRLFYLLRPAAVLRWMRHHPGRTPPMHFPTLMAEADPPAAVASLVADIIRRKAETRELGQSAMPAEIAAFADAEYVIAEAEPKPSPRHAAHAAANETFLTLIDRFAPE